MSRLIALNNRQFSYEDVGRPGNAGAGAARQFRAGEDLREGARSAAPALVVGHSLGGVTAYQLAARRPELVRALVIEDVGAVTDEPEVAHPTVDVTGWPRTFDSHAELVRSDLLCRSSCIRRYRSRDASPCAVAGAGNPRQPECVLDTGSAIL